MEALFNLIGVEHHLSAPYHPMTNGLVERQNHTTEDCIRKVMLEENDWYKVLDSVLFACHVATHCSTGVSPYRMVYNKDPILPFEYKDKLNYHSDTYLEGKNDTNSNPEFSHTLKEMEKQKDEIFSQAKGKIKKCRTTRQSVTMLEMLEFHLKSEQKF